MRNKFLGKGAFLLISVVAGSTFASGSANALWTKEDFSEKAMSVLDMACSNLFGFKEIKELKSISEPLRKARSEAMSKLKGVGDSKYISDKVISDALEAAHKHNELLKLYGWAEKDLDKARGKCIEWILRKRYPELEVKFPELDVELKEQISCGITTQNSEGKAEEEQTFKSI